MVFTRSAARVLLAGWVPVVKNSTLPEDILLEIFDAYRQLHQLQPRYENVWNSRNGWFKLTHVCRSWRRLVHSSPSRLHVHLLFTPRRPSRVTMLRRLPPFPILIDYGDVCRTLEGVNNALAGIGHRSRVRGITLRIPDRDNAKFPKALSLPFPELESLDICPDFSHKNLVLPATFLSNPAPCLRRLTLQGVIPSSLSPLLSSATGLVELSLTPQTGCMSPLEPLLTDLQFLSRLRRLELDLSCQPRAYCFVPPLPAVTGDVVLLPKLTHLIFDGHVLSLESLVVGLAAPSLQHLTAELYHQSPHIFPIPHLCKFIRDAECHFNAVCLILSFGSPLEFCAGTVYQPITDEPFSITLPERVSLKQLGQELSGPLFTVEELVITRNVFAQYTEPSIQPDQLRGFFYHLPQLKVVRIPVRMAHDVAHSFQQDDLEPVLDPIPALQRVEMEVYPEVERNGDYVEFASHAFEPLMAARAGRPIGLYFHEC